MYIHFKDVIVNTENISTIDKTPENQILFKDSEGYVSFTFESSNQKDEAFKSILDALGNGSKFLNIDFVPKIKNPVGFTKISR